MILAKIIVLLVAVSSLSIVNVWALPTKPPSPVDTPISFSFENLSVTHEKISFTIGANTTDNWDSEIYKVTLLQQSDVSNDFFTQLSPTIKANLYSITQAKESFIFENYLTLDGTSAIIPNTTYTIVILKDNTIEAKQSITTRDFMYILGLDEKHVKTKTEKYLKFQPKVNEQFTDYKVLYIFTTDTATNETTFSTIPKENLSESWYMQQVLPFTETKTFKIEIYCTTDHPKKLKSPLESKIVDGETVYLIYVHPNLIKI